MKLTMRRLAITLSLLAALIVGTTPFARADLVIPCPMMDQAGDIDGHDLPMPCSAGMCASVPLVFANPIPSTIPYSLEDSKDLPPVYAFALAGEKRAPPDRPPSI
jgi:hypothetical protein